MKEFPFVMIGFAFFLFFVGFWTAAAITVFHYAYSVVFG